MAVAVRQMSNSFDSAVRNVEVSSYVGQSVCAAVLGAAGRLPMATSAATLEAGVGGRGSVRCCDGKPRVGSRDEPQGVT